MYKVYGVIIQFVLAISYTKTKQVGIPIEFVTRRIKPVDNEELNAWRLLSHVIATRGDPELGHLIITSHDVFV